ncbi:MAG TPA: AraC family transcriptional regulator [Acidiferrobacter sp.]|nr:AraC family transcriptional regulator [Acidiferrobacter sp.]
MSDPGQGTIIYNRPTALPGIDVMRVRQNSQCWRVFHEHYVICSCRVAAAYWRYRRKDHFVTDMSHMLIEPGETHANTAILKPADFTVLWIPPAILEDAARELGHPQAPHFRHPQVSDHVLFRELASLYAAIEQGGTPLEQESRFAHCLRVLLEHHAEHTPPTGPVHRERRAIERAKRYIRDHFNEVIPLGELSRVIGLSRFHLLRSFTEQVGLPPHSYQIRLRAERARILLQHGVTLSEAALSTGFADQSHLTRHFRQILGITPGRYVALTSQSRRRGRRYTQPRTGRLQAITP